MKHLQVILVALMVTLAAAPHVLAEGPPQLRRCVNEACRRYAASEQWGFCPYCGTELPEPQPAGAVEQPVVLGNLLIDPDGYSVEKPAEDWVFLIGEEASRRNYLASSLMHSPDQARYGMIIAERFDPEAGLEDYADAVKPEMVNSQVIRQQEVEVGGAEKAMLVRYQGNVGRVSMVWDQLLAKQGDRFYQLNLWTMPFQLDEATEEQFSLVRQSFQLIDHGDAEAEVEQVQEPAAGQRPHAPPAPR